MAREGTGDGLLRAVACTGTRLAGVGLGNSPRVAQRPVGRGRRLRPTPTPASQCPPLVLGLLFGSKKARRSPSPLARSRSTGVTFHRAEHQAPKIPVMVHWPCPAVHVHQSVPVMFGLASLVTDSLRHGCRPLQGLCGAGCRGGSGRSSVAAWRPGRMDRRVAAGCVAPSRARTSHRRSVLEERTTSRPGPWTKPLVGCLGLMVLIRLVSAPQVACWPFPTGAAAKRAGLISSSDLAQPTRRAGLLSDRGERADRSPALDHA